MGKGKECGTTSNDGGSFEKMICLQGGNVERR
jgi:hypothetical protein